VEVAFDRLEPRQRLRCALGHGGVVGIFDDAPEPDIIVGHSDVDKGTIELALIQQNLYDFVSKLPIPRRSGFMMIS
jgi:hypothetical protein